MNTVYTIHNSYIHTKGEQRLFMKRIISQVEQKHV